MNRFELNSAKSKNPRASKEAHPIWRGVGFGLMVLTPILSYFGSIVLVKMNSEQHWFKIPADLYYKGGGDSLLYVKLLVGVVLFFLLFAFFQLITFILYSMFGPSRYGPLDMPQRSYRKHK